MSSVALQETPYSAQPLGLDEIRLLAIERRDGEIYLTTHVHNLTSIPKYAAVSYVWGIAPASKTVRCNGEDLFVTLTAFDMLQFLELGRLYWIDAICINQNDDKEKAVQIPLMPRVYSEASFVVIWLGISTPQLHKFMTELSRVLEIGRRWVTNIAQNIDPRTQADCVMPPREDPFWIGCYQLLHSPWLQRIWTFQEIIYAKRSIMFASTAWIWPDDFVEFVLDGRYKGYFSWEQEAVGYFCGNYSDADSAITTLRYITAIRRTLELKPNQTFPYLLFDLRNRQAKEPVDRIWGVVGLISGDKKHKLASIVDYSDKGRAEYWTTYRRAFKVIMSETESLALLSIPCNTQSHRDILPSWCPDLSQRFACSLSFCEFWNYSVNYAAQFFREFLVEQPSDMLDSIARREAIVNHERKSISFRKDDTQLCVRGFVVDTIAEVVEDPRLQDAMDYIGEASVSRLLRHPLHAVNMDWHARGLSLARRVAFGAESSCRDIPGEYFKAFFTDFRVKEGLSSLYNQTVEQVTGECNIGSMSVDLANQVRRFIDRFRDLAGHTFIATESGHFGLARPGCKVGDKLCVIYGGHPLYILRLPSDGQIIKSESSELLAEFCGSAFVPNLMPGEASNSATTYPEKMFIIE